MIGERGKVEEQDVNSEEYQEGAVGLCAATLCVDPETAAVVRQAVATKNGNFAGELASYERWQGDPLLLQKLQRAEVAVCVIDFDRDRAAGGGGSQRAATDTARPQHA